MLQGTWLGFKSNVGLTAIGSHTQHRERESHCRHLGSHHRARESSTRPQQVEVFWGAKGKRGRRQNFRKRENPMRRQRLLKAWSYLGHGARSGAQSVWRTGQGYAANLSTHSYGHEAHVWWGPTTCQPLKTEKGGKLTGKKKNKKAKIIMSSSLK